MAVQLDQQGLDLAELGRSLMTEAVDGAHQKAEADLFRERRKGCRVELAPILVRRGPALEQEIALGTVGEDLDRLIGAREPRGQSRKTAGVAALGRQHRQ